MFEYTNIDEAHHFYSQGSLRYEFINNKYLVEFDLELIYINGVKYYTNYAVPFNKITIQNPVC